MVYGASISYEIGGGIPHEYLNIHTPLGIAYPLAHLKNKHPQTDIKIIDQARLDASNEKIEDIININTTHAFVANNFYYQLFELKLLIYPE